MISNTYLQHKFLFQNFLFFTVPPLIKIRNQMVGTVNGSFALLECFVEAHPPAVNFWMHGDNRILEPSWKYKIDQKDDHYRTHMVLNITYIEPLDYGLYKCISKNEKGKTLGVFTVFGNLFFNKHFFYFMFISFQYQ